jgi:serine protease Do
LILDPDPQHDPAASRENDRMRSALPLAAALALAAPASAQTTPDLGAMLRDAQKYTVKVRATVNWPLAPEQFGTGQGTGFIIDREKGWILTNAHVAKRSPATVEVALGDSEAEWIPVERVYADNYLDIAVVRIAPERLPLDAVQAKLGCGQDVKQGSAVVAYGHPISLNFTATRGIVSSVRTLGYQEFVQMDASINPGNSGGPLLAVDAAEVIGVNTANFPGAPGLGLATSIRHVCPILDLIRKGEDPTVPNLPVYWLKSGRNESLTVAQAYPSAGANFPLRTGDLLVGVAGGPRFAALPDLHTALRGRKEKVDLVIRRGGAEQTVSVPIQPSTPPLSRAALTFSGMLITERQAVDSEASGLPPLRIEFIKQGEAAARAGFQAWDQLESVGGQRFTSIESMRDWLKDRKAGERVPFLIRRNIASFDRRIGAEYHRFEIAVSDLRLMSAAD